MDYRSGISQDTINTSQVPSPGPLVLEDDGVYTIAARATDAAGNVSEVTTTEIKLDRTAPAVTARQTRWWFLVRISATDEVSGIASIQFRYRLDRGRRDYATPWYDTGGQPVFTIPSRRVDLQYRAIDNAGNVSDIGTYG